MSVPPREPRVIIQIIGETYALLVLVFVAERGVRERERGGGEGERGEREREGRGRERGGRER